MTTILILLILGFGIWIAILILFHKKKEDIVLLFTGGLGSGKTLNADNRKNKFIRDSYKYNKKHKLPTPVVYSNIPMYYKLKRFGKRYKAIPLTCEMLMLQQYMLPNNITFIDEFSAVISQFEFDPKKNFSVRTLDEHIRFWRHYHGNKSHLILTDQCSNNIILQLRRRTNKAINCIRTRFFFGILAITDYRNIVISEEIKTFEEVTKDSADTDDHIERFVTWHLPKFIHKLFNIPYSYDDRTFSIRYELAFEKELGYKLHYNPLKQFEIIKLDPTKLYVTKIDEITKGNNYKERLHEILVERGIIKDE